MQTISTHRADELGSAARAAVENLLGRKVADEEHVTVMAFPAGPAPDLEHAPAIQALVETLDSMAADARHIPHGEMEALIDEACEHVRLERP